jgi:predicted nucleic acid-binding Zn ribbon protein
MSWKQRIPRKHRRYRKRGVRYEAAPAADALASVLGRYGIRKELREHRLLSHWHQVVGERIAKRSTPDSLSRGVLWVRVSNSAWLHELTFLREEIIKRANELTGDPPVIRDVRFHLGPRPGAAPDDDTLGPTLRIRRPRPERRPLPPSATGERLDQIRQEAAQVEDDELRDIIVEARRLLDL